MRKLFTSESVTEGHPDKVCDRISDAVLDAVLAKDSEGRVACETCCTTDTVFIAGEITSKVDVDIEGIARRVLRDIGYTGGASGFDADTCKVMVSVHKQSPDIAMGTSDMVGGAGDQDTACLDTLSLLEIPGDKLSFLFPRHAVDKVRLVLNAGPVNRNRELHHGLSVGSGAQFGVACQAAADGNNVHRVAPFIIVVVEFQIVLPECRPEVCDAGFVGHHVLDLPELLQGIGGFPALVRRIPTVPMAALAAQSHLQAILFGLIPKRPRVDVVLLQPTGLSAQKTGSVPHSASPFRTLGFSTSSRMPPHS